ncbi:hypothetical protein LCGC14_2298050 [marine sediment metagenome]|uniref:Uncharacterized protein n=1 Tax=marine sediment metagenome TaxID=412755 RepID=A0A0F9F1P3_9ZZZZ
MKKPKVEYRITCPNFGTRGHSTHVHPRKALAKAKEAAEAQDRHYILAAKGDDESMYSYYRSEIGWRAQTRTITEWEDVT